MTDSLKRGIQINQADAPCTEPPKHTLAKMWTYITPKMQDNKAFELMVTTMQPGGAAETGSHATEHAYYVISGRMQVTVEDKLYDLEPGSCLYMDKEAAHGLKVVGDEPVSFVVIFAPARMYA
jgi:mannose-6-phosphate isomerase-like protein (cupin superfamily)